MANSIWFERHYCTGFIGMVIRASGITPRLSAEMQRSLIVPTIIEISGDVGAVKDALSEVTGDLRGPLGSVIQTFGAPEMVDAYLSLGYIHDISLPSMRLLSTLSTRETIELLNNMVEVNSLHYDMPKAAPPSSPFGYGSPALSNDGDRLGGQRTAGWFGTKDVHPLLGIDIAHEQGYTGKDLDVAVIDTGVHRLHRQFQRGRVRATSVLPTTRVLEKAVGDSSGHGTWCASCITGNEQEIMEGLFVKGLCEATVLSIRALFTPLGTARDSDILKAMDIAYNSGAPIISMSLGGACEGPDCLLCAAVQDLAARNVVMCIAAGNDGEPNSVNCPGKVMEAITVGSVSMIDGAISHFSSQGPAVDCAMYGGGRHDPNSRPEEYIYSGVSPYSPLDTLIDHRRSGYGLLLGTSMATPMMAAMIALWDHLFNEQTGFYLTPADVHSILQLKGGSHNNLMGYGIPPFDWIRGYE